MNFTCNYVLVIFILFYFIYWLSGVDGDIKNIGLSDLRIAIDKFQFFCVTAPEFINNVQEQNKKVSAALLEKAKSICSSQGV